MPRALAMLVHSSYVGSRKSHRRPELTRAIGASSSSPDLWNEVHRDEDLQELAQRMLADYDARTPGQLFGEPLDLTTVQAYALQAEIAWLREERGEKVIGYKVGCTSPAVQQQLGIGEPIFGRIFDTGCFP